MDSNQGSGGRPPGTSTTSTTSTTTTQGPRQTTTTTHSTSPGYGVSVTHFGPQTTTVVSPTTTTTTSQSPGAQSQTPQSPAPSADPARSNSGRDRSGSIRIRRPTSSQQLMPSPSPQPQLAANDDFLGGRRRSSSEPRPVSSALFPDDNDLRRQMTGTPLQPLYEENSRPANADNLAPTAGPPPSRGPSNRRQTMQRQISALNIRRGNNNAQHHSNTMDANVVDVLDVIGQLSLWQMKNMANTIQTLRSPRSRR